MNTNLYLNGFFQSSYYFNDNFDRIKKHFNCEIRNIAIDIINKYKSTDKKLVAIHIRGGDYIKKSEYHKLLDTHYYDNCVNQIDNDTEYVLFTDDIKYATDNFSDYFNENIDKIIENNIEEKYKYLAKNSELSFFLMSLFDIIICANSTFSLWASYFSNAEKIFIPKEWFGPSGPKDFTTEEFILNENYIRI